MQHRYLTEGWNILTAWAEHCTGPGWANDVVWVVLQKQGTNKLHLECIQPEEHTTQIVALREVSEACSNAMAAYVSQIMKERMSNRTGESMEKTTDQHQVDVDIFNTDRFEVEYQKLSVGLNGKIYVEHAELRRLLDTERLWVQACAIARTNCPVDVGRSHIHDGIPKLRQEIDELRDALGICSAAMEKPETILTAEGPRPLSLYFKAELEIAAKALERVKE